MKIKVFGISTNGALVKRLKTYICCLLFNIYTCVAVVSADLRVVSVTEYKNIGTSVFLNQKAFHEDSSKTFIVIDTLINQTAIKHMDIFLPTNILCN